MRPSSPYSVVHREGEKASGAGRALVEPTALSDVLFLGRAWYAESWSFWPALPDEPRGDAFGKVVDSCFTRTLQSKAVLISIFAISRVCPVAMLHATTVDYPRHVSGLTPSSESGDVF